MLKVALKIVINHSLQAHKSAKYLPLCLRQRNIYSANSVRIVFNSWLNMQSNTTAIMLPRPLVCHWRPAISRHTFAYMCIHYKSHSPQPSFWRVCFIYRTHIFSAYRSKGQMQKHRNTWEVDENDLFSSQSGGLALFWMQFTASRLLLQLLGLTWGVTSLMRPFTSPLTYSRSSVL